MIRHMLYGLGNDHPELGRVLWGLGVLAMIAYQGVDIWWNKNAFNAVEFGAGLAAILAAGGFGIAAKDKGVATAKATGEAA